MAPQCGRMDDEEEESESGWRRQRKRRRLELGLLFPFLLLLHSSVLAYDVLPPSPTIHNNARSSSSSSHLHATNDHR